VRVLAKRIDIKGFIIPQEDAWIYEWFEYPYTTADMVNKALKDAAGGDVEVYINSYGGAVHIGSEIYTSLKEYKGNVLIKIVGYAASAASVIAMASKCIMSPTAQIMMHNASTGAQGDYRVMDRTSIMLQKVNKSVLNAYKLKSGLSEEELKAKMDEETWLTAEEALELGLIDEIMFNNEDNQTAPVLYNNIPIPSMKAIEELRECGSVEKFKENIINSKIQPTNSTAGENKIENNGEVENNMTLEELKEKYPDLYNSIFNEGKEEGIKAERERIKSIDDLLMPGHEEIINNAKYETGITAEKLAVELIKAEKQRGTDFLEERKIDAQNSNANDVKGTAAPVLGEDDETKEEDIVNKIAEGGNKRRDK